MEESNSLVIEVFGLKATALGTLSVTGLLVVLSLAILGMLIVGPTQLGAWKKRLGKLLEK